MGNPIVEVPLVQLNELIQLASDACQTSLDLAKEAQTIEQERDKAKQDAGVYLQKIASTPALDAEQVDRVTDELVHLGCIPKEAREKTRELWKQSPNNLLTFLQKFARHLTEAPAEGEPVANAEKVDKAKDPDGWTRPD